MYGFELTSAGSYDTASRLRGWIDLVTERCAGQDAYLFGCVPVEIVKPFPLKMMECCRPGGSTWTTVENLHELLLASNFHFEWFGLVVIESFLRENVPDDLKFVDGLDSVETSDLALVKGATIEILVLDATWILARSSRPDLVEELKHLEFTDRR